MSSHEPAPGERAPLSYTIIPCAVDKRPHAVWNFVLLAVRYDSRIVPLHSVCERTLIPNPRPLHAKLCADCARKLVKLNAIARPMLTHQQLEQLAQLMSERQEPPRRP